MAGGTNKTNEYQQVISLKLYEKIPKSVLAAIVVSEYMNRLGIEPDNVDKAILAEWNTLRDNGIVPQKPPAS